MFFWILSNIYNYLKLYYYMYVPLHFPHIRKASIGCVVPFKINLFLKNI